jgi:hypothetical protein
LGVGEEPEEPPGSGSAEAEAVAEQAAAGKPMTVDAMKALAARIDSRHEAIGYKDFAGWIEAHT